MVKLMGKFLQHMSAKHKEVCVKNSYPNSPLFCLSDLQFFFFALLTKRNSINDLTIQFSIKTYHNYIVGALYRRNLYP